MIYIRFIHPYNLKTKMKGNRISIYFFCLSVLIVCCMESNAEVKAKSDSICTHKVIRNADGKLLRGTNLKRRGQVIPML